jgi:nicotinamide-nucleotide amidase
MADLATLSIELGATLSERNLTMALAESCTGGLVAAKITDIAGSSAWFERGFVTYSNEAKIEMLGVSAETLEKFGAVSEETAKEMAHGALKNSRAQVAGSITGIAGPDGGSKEKPVGTVCFAWSFGEVGHKLPLSSATKRFFGNRQEVRQQAAIAWMAGLIERLKLVDRLNLEN